LLALANQHEQQGRLDEAEEILDGILSGAPQMPGAVHQKGIVAFRRGRAEEVGALMERSIALAPGSALFHRNLCEVYRVQGRFDDALVIGERATALDPMGPHCHHNLGVVHYDRLALDEAIHCAERALQIDPNFAGGHFGIAEASLLRGDFTRGWEEYEWRAQLTGVPPLLPPNDRPQWDGTPLGHGRTPLLVADQGYGDVIQFARYIPWAAARCPDIAIACSRELQGVVAQLPGAGMIFDHWSRAPILPPFAGCRGCRVSPARICSPSRPIFLICAPARRNSLFGPNGCGRCCRAATAASGSSGRGARPIATICAARPGSPPSRRWRRSRKWRWCRCKRGRPRPRSAVLGPRTIAQPWPRDPRFRRHDGDITPTRPAPIEGAGVQIECG
jgi:Tetratricopeptide repeat